RLIHHRRVGAGERVGERGELVEPAVETGQPQQHLLLALLAARPGRLARLGARVNPAGRVDVERVADVTPRERGVRLAGRAERGLDSLAGGPVPDSGKLQLGSPAGAQLLVLGP